MRDTRVGVIVAMGLAGILGFMFVAGGGPGFLAKRRTIDVIFRDGQGIRTGSPVRVAGIDAGRVADVALVPVDGVLRARVRIVVPAELANRLRQDLKVTIQASLTGQSLVNVVDSGRSEQPLVPGQLVAGVESSFLDPVLEQVGLGPVERSHLSHTIAEVRQTVDTVGPQLRSVLGGLNEAVGDLRETVAAVRPAVEVSAGRLELLARRLDTAKFDETLTKLNALVHHAEGMVAENRVVVQNTLATIKLLAGDIRAVIARDGPKVDLLLDGFHGTRERLDQVLHQAHLIATQGSEILTLNRVNIDRSFGNVRDATDYGSKLVQKLYGNPFYLSPFYKPTAQDIQAQAIYDTANSLMLGARELKDAVTTLKAMQAKTPYPQMSPSEQKFYETLLRRALAIEAQLDPVANQLAEGLRNANRR